MKHRVIVSIVFATWSPDTYETTSSFTVSLATLDALLTAKGPILDSRTDGRQGPMLDVVFVAVTLIFFALCVGYVGLCDRLGK